MKILSQKFYDYSMIALFLLLIFLIGTYFPNDSVKQQIRQDTINQIKKIGFFEPKVDNSSSENFLNSMKKCIAYINLDLTNDQQVPIALIIAQSIVESDFGTSRFAKEGNNIFGVRVWSKNGILPYKQDPSINWRIKTYSTKCQSTRDYINILNNNHHYSDFRTLRKRTKDPIKLAETLENYSTSQTYRTELVRMINKIKDKI
jgi:Bax protein